MALTPPSSPFTKDKDGIVRREVLTKQWTDWVDYWAVDFNYESRKVIDIFGNDTMTLVPVNIG